MTKSATESMGSKELSQEHSSKPLTVYFGGTFDPPHLGHHQILKYLIGRHDVRRVIVVPTGQNPLKEKVAASRDLRKMWTSNWIARVKSQDPQGSKIALDFRELESTGVAFTVDTLAALKKEFAQEYWALAVGVDAAQSLDRWREPQRLLKMLTEFWIFPRGKHKVTESDWSRSLSSLCHFRFLDIEIADISSTEIRERCAKLVGQDKDWVNALTRPEVRSALAPGMISEA